MYMIEMIHYGIFINIFMFSKGNYGIFEYLEYYFEFKAKKVKLRTQRIINEINHSLHR